MNSTKDFSRPVIYQLLVRTFGNSNTSRKFDGTISENGCGKFHDINAAALDSIKQMGFNHIWLTGVIEQASGTSYPNRPADVPDILKGKAGSPYAIKDYFDVCPDYAIDPENRLEEFRDLLARCKKHGLKTIIDFVPNHVARSYESDVRPELSFGENDDTDVFFHRENHFYYLTPDRTEGGPPLKLPTAEMTGCTGFFEQEKEIGKVTGNNSVTWTPSLNDWYETLKINYGHDFTAGRRTEHLPSLEASVDEVPKTWKTMDAIIAHWQEIGVDGFRADMAHIVPIEFWRWMVKQARERDPNVFFCAEAYDSDPAKLTDEDVLGELRKAGFNGSYEHPTYKILQGIYEGGKWANDIDTEIFSGDQFHDCIRYTENHDEVRIANPNHWGAIGMNAGKPAAAVMFGISRAAIMLYSGQEVGEPAIGAEGFSGDDGRSSIFDYTSLPELQKWSNEGAFDGAKLSAEQKDLRQWYGKLLSVLNQPAFTKGEFYGLNHANLENPNFGRVDGEGFSGHWLYVFLRHDVAAAQSFLCVVNFHPTESLSSVRVNIPKHALEFLGKMNSTQILLEDKLGSCSSVEALVSDLSGAGVEIGSLKPLSASYFSLM